MSVLHSQGLGLGHRRLKVISQSTWVLARSLAAQEMFIKHSQCGVMKIECNSNNGDSE